MRSTPHDELRMFCRTTECCFGGARAALLAILVLALPRTPVQAQGGVLVQGLADVEVYATDARSPLLTRNDGRPAALGRLQLWGALEPWRGIVAFAQGQLEGGPARADEERMELYLDQFGVRLGRSRALVLEAGKMPHPVGAFASRRFSSRNPLIGTPDGYPLQYPLGAALTGSTQRIDYRAALVSLPITHEGYLPDPTPKMRPAIGGGITPTAGIRIGGSATWGPYLNDSLTPGLLAGRRWDAYRECVIAADAQVSRGYLETRGEIAWSSYEVPARAALLRGLTYYLEAKYTIAPRVYVAARYERNDYPFMRPASDSAWLAQATNLYDGEVAIGVRLAPSRLVKLAYRADSWRVEPWLRSFLRDGHSVALQVSQAFDLW